MGRKAVITDAQRADMVARAVAGEQYASIGKLHGCNAATVSKIARSAGIRRMNKLTRIARENVIAAIRDGIKYADIAAAVGTVESAISVIAMRAGIRKRGRSGGACEVAGCDLAAKVKGMCQKHYRKAWAKRRG